MPLRPLRAADALLPGARVALVAPAGGLRGEEDLERALANARSLGWEPVPGRNALARSGYFAGTDEQRLADLDAALTDRDIDGIWCIRGGYGTMRILARLDFTRMRVAPRPVIGFSDVTALHCALQTQCGVMSYHGPVARAELTDFTRSSLQRAVVELADPCGAAPHARTIREGTAEGVLAGGNLAVLAALAGTRYSPNLDGAIVVLEDVDEPIYRVDRLLRQLYLAGVLAGCRGIAFGACVECGERAESGARSLDEVLLEMAELLQVPCVAGLPVGHIADQWTLPLGAPALLDAGERILNVIR